MRARATIGDYFWVVSDWLGSGGFDIGRLRAKDIRVCLHYIGRCEGVSDFRSPHLVTYRLDSMVMMVMLSLACWKTSSFLEMARWCRGHRRRLRQWGVIEGEETPSHDTFRRFVMLFDPEPLRGRINSLIDGLFRRVAKRAGARMPEMRQIAADGKELRGTGRAKGTRSPQGNLATLNVVDLSTGVCLSDEVIGDKESEIPKVREALGAMDLRRTVLTADALHCQRETCSLVIRKRGHYVLYPEIL